MTTYADFIGLRLKNKIVQIYLGDQHELAYYDDHAKTVNATIVGRVIEAEGECIVIDCMYLDSEKKQQFGNIHYVNTQNIKTITELDGQGSTKEAFRSVNSIK